MNVWTIYIFVVMKRTSYVTNAVILHALIFFLSFAGVDVVFS